MKLAVQPKLKHNNARLIRYTCTLAAAFCTSCSLFLEDARHTSKIECMHVLKYN